MTKSSPSPRLFVLFAAAADQAVIFRRGPSGWYHLVQWDTAQDKFDHGAWLRGRLYEEKCDLSPDGCLLLYFVHQGRKGRTAYTDSWTGVSRSPWLAALGLWPSGTTYGGGGRFTGCRRVVLRQMARPPHPDHPGDGLHVEFGDAPTHVAHAQRSDWQWSGRDQKGHLVFAQEGCLFRRKRNSDELLIDLRNLTPSPEAAPLWATRPLKTLMPATSRLR
jgi:hypothetical protein